MVGSFSLNNALLIVLIGLVVVFIGLVILVVVCRATGVAFVSKKNKPQDGEVLRTEPDEDGVFLSQGAAGDEDPDEIAAVIAAVTALMTSPSYAAAKGAEKIEGFYVRRIRRAASATAWGKAGREELLSSKNF